MARDNRGGASLRRATRRTDSDDTVNAAANTVPAGSDGASPRPAPPQRVAAAPRQLQTRWLVAAAVMVLLGGAVLLYAVPLYAGHTTVVVLARDVKMGSTLTAADLTTSDVSVSPQVAVVHPQDQALIGKTALTDLSAGAVLSPRQIGEAPTLAAGQQVVPVRLKLGQRPERGLATGQLVLAVPAPADPAAPVGVTLSQAQPVRASVASAGEPDPATGDVVVDLRVPDSDAVSLARIAATGSLTLVLLPGAAQ